MFVQAFKIINYPRFLRFSNQWKTIYLLGGLWVLASVSVRAQIDVKAQLDTSSILIGDHVNLQITINHDADVVVTDMALSVIDSTNVIETLDAGSLDTITKGDGYLLARNLTITSFDSGYHWVPPIPVTFEVNGNKRLIRTNRLPLEVRTIPISGDSLSIAPIKPIIKEPLKFIDIVPYLLGIAGLVGLVFLVLFLLRRKPKEPKRMVVPVSAPHVIALEKIN